MVNEVLRARVFAVAKYRSQWFFRNKRRNFISRTTAITAAAAKFLPFDL
jgi:hypothetical protein